MVIPLNVTLPLLQPGLSHCPQSHHTQQMSQAGGHLLEKPILGAELGNLAVFNREVQPPRFLPWDALLTFPALTTN